MLLISDKITMSSVTRYTYDYEGEMVQVATDRQGLASGVEIYVNIARMLFETLEGQVFKVHKTKYRWRCVTLVRGNLFFGAK